MRASAIWYRCLPSKAVPASAAQASVRVVSPLAGSKATSRSPVATHTRCPSCVTPWMRSAPSKGPYSRTISAGAVRAGEAVWRVLLLLLMVGFLSLRVMADAVEPNLRERQRGRE